MPPKQTRDGAPPLKYTSFNVVGYLNAKNVASGLGKNDNQSWFSRRTTSDEWDAARESKRRKLMASEEELEQLEKQNGADFLAGKPKLNVLTSAPEGKVRRARESSAGTTDPLAQTIVIHPGSRWLRIGRASEIAPLAVPNVIARKSRSFAPSTETLANDSDKEPQLAARPQAPVPTGDTAPVPAVSDAAVPATVDTEATAVVGVSSDVSGGDSTMSELPPNENDYDSEDSTSTPRPANGASGTKPIDPLSAKIMSIKADLRARMRAYKLRGQGNGNSQAATYNATVKPESMGEEFEGDHEWTIGEAEVWVGNKAVRIPDPLASGYVLRHPYQRGGFNTTGYVSQQEFLGDLEMLYATVIKDELGIDRDDLKNYSVILLIPDLYEELYVREMSNLLLTTLGFKQMCIMQESVCSTFGAGISSACVVDIGASKTSITCIEEGLVVPETRMVLDFGGDDITSFMHALLSRNGFPYKEADLTKWYDWIVLEDIKERSVVLSEGDIGLNLYDFYIRHPGAVTKKYTMRMYDDCILAPYALFAPRVIDFEKKMQHQPELWNKNVDNYIEIGQGGITNAMKNSTRHLLLPTTSVHLAAPTAASNLPPSTTEASSRSGTPGGEDPSALAPVALPPLPGFSAASTVPPSLAGSPAPDKPVAVTQVPQQVEIDVRHESSKMPLDVAVVESILAAGAEERMRKVAANLLIVGGTGGIHNIGFAVESRIAPQLIARVPSLSGHVSYVPGPREIEPENLAWKGISVLIRIEASNELWTRQEDWQALGMRAVRDRAFFWAG
ncbi:uncharacterized protein JCM15063_004664 [Sporobolomyces koalae]|uniref:uncharacterized protein n=1 Tax=Sporobolomyces koalae TaxID=500713 RepID=UPI00316DC14F